MKRVFLILQVALFTLSCNTKAPHLKIVHNETPAKPVNNAAFDTATKTIHVFVALCDNKYQGIVPVPAKLVMGKTLIITCIGVVVMACGLILKIVRTGYL